MSDEVIINAHGTVYRHKKAAQVGDMWKRKPLHDNKVVVVYEINDYYVKVFNCNNTGDTYDWHKLSFYSCFERIED